MIIGNAISPMKTTVAAAVAQLLLDQYSDSVGAWSVSRKLRTAYTGDCIKVREDGGDTVADIGFDGNGDLDETALLLHCGVNSGFIHTIYDQSGLGNDAVQTTASRQPRIALNGVVGKSNGKPAMFFDRVNDFLGCGLLGGGTKLANYSIFDVLETNYTAGTHTYFLGNSNSTGQGRYMWGSMAQSSAGLLRGDYGNGTLGATSISASNVIVSNVQGVFYMSYKTGDLGQKLYYNDSIDLTSSVSGTPTSTTGTEYNFSIGRTGDLNGSYYGGYKSEIVVFDVENATNKDGIRDNINTHYNTY